MRTVVDPLTREPSAAPVWGGHLVAREFPSSRDVLESYLSLLSARLLDQDRRLRIEETDSVHEMRVTCSRIRALLACFNDEVDAAPRRHLAAELSWLASRLGESRDLEVVHAYVESLPIAENPEAVRFLADVSRFRQSAAWDLRANLASCRYLAALDLVRQPSASLRWRPRAEGPWRTELGPALAHAYGKVLRATVRAENADREEVDAALHLVRRRVRTLRYAAEAVEPLDRAAYSPLVGRLIASQNLLGIHHDAVVVEGVLGRMSRTGQDPSTKAWLREAAALVGDDKRAAIRKWHKQRHVIGPLPF
jgi:CHAD domain-containing protein